MARLEKNSKYSLENTETALHAAVRNKDVKTTKLLLNQGANVDATNKDGRTPLHIAIIPPNGRRPKRNDTDSLLEIIKVLLENKANVNALDRTNKTPLHMAAMSARRKWIQILVEYGADVNAIDEGGRTPLFTLIYSGDMRRLYFSTEDSVFSVETLLDNGSDVNIEYKFETTLLMYMRSMIIFRFDNGMEYTYYRSFAEKLTLHMIKLKAAGLYVSEKNLRVMKELEDEWKLAHKWALYELECRKEVEQMRSREGTSICLLHILTTDSPRYALNRTFRRLISLNHDDLPKYRNLLECKYERDRKRITLLEKSKKSLIGVLKRRDKKVKPVFLLSELLDRILYHLNNSDLQDLISRNGRKRGGSLVI